MTFDAVRVQNTCKPGEMISGHFCVITPIEGERQAADLEA